MAFDSFRQNKGMMPNRFKPEPKAEPKGAAVVVAVGKPKGEEAAEKDGMMMGKGGGMHEEPEPKPQLGGEELPAESPELQAIADDLGLPVEDVREVASRIIGSLRDKFGLGE